MLKLSLASLLAAVAVFGPNAQAPAPPSTTRILHINAIDAHQAPVSGLDIDDIVIKEDGKSREVLSVEPATDPLQIIILVDDSGTGVFRYGLAAFAQRMQGRAAIAFKVVTNQVQTIVDSTTDVNEWLVGAAQTGVRPATPEGGQLLEGIFESAKGLGRREARRPVILALTVGGEEQSPRQPGQVLDELWRSGAALHVLFVDSPAVRPARAISKPSDLLGDTFNLSRVLAAGPKESGGQRRDVLTTGVLHAEVQEVARNLLGQYAIRYVQPITKNPPRRLQVTSQRPGVTIVAPSRVPIR